MFVLLVVFPTFTPLFTGDRNKTKPPTPAFKMALDTETALNYQWAGAFIAANVFWVVVSIVLARRGKKVPLSGKYTDKDWQLAQDQADSEIVTKEGGRALHGAEQFVPYTKYVKHSPAEMEKRAADFYSLLNARRTVRDYSTEEFPISIVQECIKVAGTAPSGANLQPWTYVIVQDPKIKSQIRQVVEDQEAINYARRMKESWKEDLSHLGTDANKPYLDEAPYLVCVFKHAFRVEDGERLAVYYPEQSVGISVGMFQVCCNLCCHFYVLLTQAALHNVGLCTLTSTPMGAEASIKDMLDRPENERLYLLMPVGYPKNDVQIPNITRKPIEEISATV